MFVFLVVKLVLSFCSIAYELILAQTLSAFLANTVLRYSTTIGLYMLCMGIGAFLVSRPARGSHALVLWRAEILLVLLGALAVPSLFALDFLGVPESVFLLTAYAFIALIGVLTGVELPLVLQILAKRKASQKEDLDDLAGIRSGVITADYLGAFAGTVAFAFYFYPRSGIIAAGWQVAVLNLAAAMLIRLACRGELKTAARISVLHMALLFLLATCLIASGRLEEFFVNLYLR